MTIYISTLLMIHIYILHIYIFGTFPSLSTRAGNLCLDQAGVSKKINLRLSLSKLIHQFTLYASCMCIWRPHLRFSRAVFSGYTALLPLTGMWYLISFQNLEEGEREGDSPCLFSSNFSSSWASLRHVRHLCRCLWFFHQHTAPCFFLRWRTDSGNRASWAGLISSSSTRITCKEGIKLESRCLFWTRHWGETTLIEAPK